MTTSIKRVGVATLACAVLSGVEPAELQDAAVADDVVALDASSPSEELVRQVRRLSSNSTGDGLNTGSIVAIIVGSAAAVVIVVGLLWFFMCRKPPMYKPMKDAAPNTPFGEIDVPDARELPPNFFRASAGGEQAEIPLLRLPSSTHGAGSC